MKKFMKLSIIAISFMSLSANALIIKAEESEGQFLRITEQRKGFYFEKCNLFLEKLNCSPLIGEDTFFTKAELNALSKSNYRNSLYAVGGDIAAIAGGIILGSYAGLGIGMYLLSYHGAALACGAFLTGTIPGAVTGIAADIAFDNLDPFVHRDIAITYEAILDTASRGDLDDVDASFINDELSVVVEDLNFEQLEEKFSDQLSDVVKKKSKSRRTNRLNNLSY